MEGFDWRNPDYGPVFVRRISMLENLRAKPELIPGVKAYYRDNPVAFITDFGMTFDPRLVERGIESTVPFLLFPKQADFIEWVVARWKGREDGVVEKSRDMGMSWLTVAVSVWMWLFYEGVVVGFGSRKESYVDDTGNPASLFWKIRQFIGLLPQEFRPAGWDEKKHAPFMRILNPENGSSIIGEAGDNIGRGNRTAIYFVDEAAFLERPELVDAALSQTSNCKIHVSTPNGAGNPFYRKVHGGKIAKFTFHWRDDPRKDDAWYETQRRNLEPHVVAQEIDCNYEASVVNAFCDGADVKAAQLRGPANFPATGRLRVGVDPARFGDDKFAVCIRRGSVCIAIHETQKLDTIQGAYYVKSLIDPFGERPEQIAVDEIGIGAGVVDQLKAIYGNIVVGINSSLRMDGEKNETAAFNIEKSTQTVYYNLRAFMWGEMREWLKRSSIPVDHDLKSELTSVRYGYRGGSLLLESKDDMRKRGVKSPNKADALALTFASPKAPDDFQAYDVFTNHNLSRFGSPNSRAGY